MSGRNKLTGIHPVRDRQTDKVKDEVIKRHSSNWYQKLDRSLSAKYCGGMTYVAYLFARILEYAEKRSYAETFNRQDKSKNLMNKATCKE